MQQNIPAEEKANVLTHGLGILICLLLIPFMLFHYATYNSRIELLGCIIFSLALLHTYIVSTIYHKAIKKRRKEVFRIWDHISIYFLIGGSYTAFLLKYYNNSDGYLFLAIHWIIIFFGVLFKIFYTGRFEKLSTGLYLLLGWMGVYIYPDFSQNMESFTEFWLIAGGLMYTFGVIFYLVNRIPYHHAIWHLFVLGGSVSHLIALNSWLFN